MHHIFVIEQDRQILEMLSFILTEEGFNVVGVDYFSSAVLENLEQRPLDLAMIDFKLNGKEAIHACNAIKISFPDVPIFAMSCNVDIDREFEQHGFDKYLAKPFDIDEMLALISVYLK